MIKNIIKFIGLFVILLFLSEFSYSQYEQYYDQVPNILGCETGILKQAEKDKVLTLLNKIRDLHALPRFEYEASFDDDAAEVSLIIVANLKDHGFSQQNHKPPTDWHCYSDVGYNGGVHANLLYSGGTPTSESSVLSWLNDQGVPSLGHRRWILDPFVKKVAFGRVDGIPFGGDVQDKISGMAFYYDWENQANINSWNHDFVACPFGDYPPTYFDKDAAISFTYIPIKSSRSNNTDKVIYGGTIDGIRTDATIEMEDESGYVRTYSTAVAGQVGTNYDGAGIANVIYWYYNGLKDLETYKVRIKHVWVNGQYKDIPQYEFTLRDPFITKPSSPTLSEPANNAVDINPNVTLKWGSAQGANYYILQISKTINFNQLDIVFNNETVSGTNYYVTGVLEPMKKYYWRVSAKNDAGTGGWSPIWSFTTTTAPDAPTLAGPANNSTNVSLTPTLTWNTADKADKYQLQVSDASNFSLLLVDKNDITQTSYTVESEVLSTQTKYFWRVRSISNISGPSTWSEVRNFTTAVAAPGKPDLLSPEQGAKDQSATLQLVWSSVPGSESYDLMISLSNLYNEWDIVLDQKAIVNTYFRVPQGKLDLETQYFWRVRSNGPGGTSEWSKNGRFTVGDASPVEDMKYTPVSVSIYPNPVTESAGIFLTVIEKASIELSIINIMGEKVATIVNAELNPGDYILNYDCSALPSGVYYYRMTTANVNITGKINIIK